MIRLDAGKGFWVKFAAPAVLGVGVLVVLVGLRTGGWDDALAMAAVYLGIAFFALLGMGRYVDRVDLDIDDACLHVQSGKRQARVALADVERVQYHPGSRSAPPNVEVHLRRGNHLGNSFAFLVSREFSLAEHSAAVELRARVAMAAQGGGART